MYQCCDYIVVLNTRVFGHNQRSRYKRYCSHEVVYFVASPARTFVMTGTIRLFNKYQCQIERLL
jgi:hypothetical protein